MNKPVTILTGFLGSGKTTFLNHLLKENEETRYAIIENEFGQQGIDNELIIRPEETIVELNNGCLCCTLNDNLYEILNELFERRDDFDEIIIEATGVADPSGLAQPFIAHPLIKKHFPLKAVICLVDAELIENHLQETEEAINQVILSDVLLINKIDLVTPTYVKELEARLGQLSPLASIVKGQKGQFPPIDYSGKHQKLEDLLLPNGKLPTGKEEQFPVHKPHHHHHHDHTEEIVSQTFIFDTPFDHKMLQHQLIVYLTFQAKGLYRLKGLVWLKDDDRQFVIQSVGKRVDFQEKRPWRAGESKKSILVFIGKRLQRKGLERLLNKCLAATNPIAK